MNYCKCNCGQIVNKNWATGHHRRGTTFKLPESAIEKIRHAQSTHNSMRGKDAWNKGKKGVFTEEQIQKIKAARVKQIFTPEQIEKARIGTINGWKKCTRYKGGESTKKERMMIYQQNREARKRKNGGTFTLLEWESVKLKFGNMCLCCKRTEPNIKLTIDHIIPISKGGKNSIENIQPLCFSCNARKNAKHIDYISLYEINLVGTQS